MMFHTNDTYVFLCFRSRISEIRPGKCLLRFQVKIMSIVSVSAFASSKLAAATLAESVSKTSRCPNSIFLRDFTILYNEIKYDVKSQNGKDHLLHTGCNCKCVTSTNTLRHDVIKYLTLTESFFSFLAFSHKTLILA